MFAGEDAGKDWFRPPEIINTAISEVQPTSGPAPMEWYRPADRIDEHGVPIPQPLAMDAMGSETHQLIRPDQETQEQNGSSAPQGLQRLRNAATVKLERVQRVFRERAERVIFMTHFQQFMIFGFMDCVLVTALSEFFVDLCAYRGVEGGLIPLFSDPLNIFLSLLWVQYRGPLPPATSVNPPDQRTVKTITMAGSVSGVVVGVLGGMLVVWVLGLVL